MKTTPMMPEEYLAQSIERLARTIIKISSELSAKEFDQVWRETIKKLNKEERKIFGSYIHLLLREIAPEMEC